MQIDALHELSKGDVTQAATATADSFTDDPLFRYILGEKCQPEYLRTLLKYYIKYSVLYGEAYASSAALDGIVLCARSREYDYSLFKSLRAGSLSLIRLGSEAGSRFKTYDAYAAEKHEAVISDPHIFIQLLAVAPDQQGEGHGGSMLSSVVENATEAGYPCYLETHTERNVSFYRKYGFETASTGEIPGTDITHYCLLRD
ncbi:acetyltransferase [Halorhabdus utahensis DSM 12940]|uniref:Acetyltransferase n=1 Tax=Halorhabdus utahensis (strain DSM 12940 / JCM 11049 / AX-2) TaxID=519442 RepID=C7NVJ1_HALUD|nr:GNAT family N-acetyltransferase [Halorhabdus utahensis]ACV12514.1 acetyltransferase [Halorhabdus utahensis DSM 12940]